MKTFALAAAFLLAGCAATGTRTTVTGAPLRLPNKGEQISEREQQCIRQAVNRANGKIAQIEATPNALTASQTRQAKNDQDREVSECIANADREKALLSASERSEYESEAQRAHDRAALMMILTTSQPC